MRPVRLGRTRDTYFFETLRLVGLLGLLRSETKTKAEFEATAHVTA